MEKRRYGQSDVELSVLGTEVRPVKFSDSEVDTIFDNCTIIINATSLGLKGTDPLPLDAGRIRAEHTVVDLVYGSGPTPVQEAGASKGARTVGGYGMLVFQAREAFRLWTGRVPPLEVMWDAGSGGKN